MKQKKKKVLKNNKYGCGSKSDKRNDKNASVCHLIGWLRRRGQSKRTSAYTVTYFWGDKSIYKMLLRHGHVGRLRALKGTKVRWSDMASDSEPCHTAHSTVK